MIANFFRHLDGAGVRWLLVSGQATILYGAATFSEDVDLWVEPTAKNLELLRAALAACGARYYKLTPPVTEEYARRHHGFHFVVPDEQGTAVYLDVMGCPPRVGSFEDSHARARIFDTAWGQLRAVAIPDLVELKKTQRPHDYPIISRLALAFLREQASVPGDATLRWIVDNVFTLAEFRELSQLAPAAIKIMEPGSLEARAMAVLASGLALDSNLEDELEEWFDARTAPLRRADRHFWRSVIDELRELRAGGKLAPEGALVS